MKVFLLIFLVPAEKQAVNKMQAESCTAVFIYFIIPGYLRWEDSAHYKAFLIEIISLCHPEESHRWQLQSSNKNEIFQPQFSREVLSLTPKAFPECREK